MLRVEYIINGGWFTRNGGYIFRQGIDLSQGDIHSPPDIPDSSPGFHPAERDNLSYPLLTVPIDGISNHLFPLIIRIIQVKIGHRNTAWIKESFKNEIVA